MYELSEVSPISTYRGWLASELLGKMEDAKALLYENMLFAVKEYATENGVAI